MSDHVELDIRCWLEQVDMGPESGGVKEMHVITYRDNAPKLIIWPEVRGACYSVAAFALLPSYGYLATSLTCLVFYIECSWCRSRASRSPHCGTWRSGSALPSCRRLGPWSSRQSRKQVLLGDRRRK